MERKKHTIEELYINSPDMRPYDEKAFTSAEMIYQKGIKDGDFEIAKKQGTDSGRIWQLPDEAIPGVVSQIRQEIIQLEHSARSPHRRELTNEEGAQVQRIIRFGAPGLYHSPYKPSGTEMWSNFPWAANLERFADDAAALTLIGIVAKRYNIHVPDINSLFVIDGNNKQLNDVRKVLQDAIIASGIRIAYFGSNMETAAVEEILSHNQSLIPASSVDVIQGYIEDEKTLPIKNTVHQAKAYRDYIMEHGGEGVDMLVDFAVRIPRQAHTIGMYAPTSRLWMSPAATPKDAQVPLGEMEVRGTTSYVIRGDATYEMPPNYSIIGSP